MLLILLRFVHFLVLQGSFKSFQYNINEELLKVTLHQMEQQFFDILLPSNLFRISHIIK